MADDEQEKLQDALRLTAVALKEAGIPYALCGSYAAWARGAPEPRHDADFVVREDDVERARTAIAGAGLDVRDPAEDWLFKAYHGDALVDVLFRMCGEPVTDEMLGRADELEVLAVRMPVLSSTDLVSAKLRVLNEHYCDFALLLPTVRALREQLDWDLIRRETKDSPFARAFLHLADDLRLTETGAPAA